MSDTDVSPSVRSPFALRGGMLLGLAVFAITVAGLILLESLKSRLGAMSPGANQGWITYDFMDDHIVVLSLVWTSLCVAIPLLYLTRRRKWRCLTGMLIVLGPALIVLLGFLLYVAALSNGLHAATG